MAEANLSLLKRACWLKSRLAAPDPLNSTKRAQIALTYAVVFFIALGVRLLHWQDISIELEQGQTMAETMGRAYRAEARRIIQEGRILFPEVFDGPSDARMLLHPPGYPIFMAATYSLLGSSDRAVRLLQIICDAAAAVMVLLVAAELLPLTVALVGSLLVALSPHLAYYSLWLSPDTLAVLPILIAVYFIIRACKRSQALAIIAAGAFLGLSCWLRSNALLLAPFLAILVALLCERGKRLRYSTALVATTALVISPITIRNFILYRQLIPLSLGAGITLIEGIADYDRENRFGMPSTDEEVAEKEAAEYGRPDYAGNEWVPDGISRDRARFARGLQVVRSNPVWFLTVMLRRAAFMLSYNDSRRRQWPLSTAIVPVVSAEPPFGHPMALSSEARLVWSSNPSELLTTGAVISPQAQVSLEGESLQLRGDGSDFGDQFASALVPVKENTDYLLVLPVELEQGHIALKVATADRRVALSSVMVPEKLHDEQAASIRAPFASGERNEVLLVLSNNGAGPLPVAKIGRADLFELGSTPHLWTRLPRVLVRGLQKNLFTTARMLTLILVGALLLVLASRVSALMILLAVPFYYLCLQSALHTEYRYILAIHYFLFVVAATSLYCLALAISQGARAVFQRLGRAASPKCW
jgi:hypothetical protein